MRETAHVCALGAVHAKMANGFRVFGKLIGIKHLTREVNVFTKDEYAKEDLQDMQELYNWVYPSYVPVQGWGEEIQRPTTVTTHLNKQGGYYGT